MQLTAKILARLALAGIFVFSSSLWALASDKQPTRRKKPKSSPSAVAATKSSARRGKRAARKAKGEWWRESSLADSAAGDVLDGEDLTVRQAAVDGLGPLNGSVVVVDPNTGRVLAMVNQKLALASGFTPCSTIKVPVALAALNEGVISLHTKLRLGRQWFMNLTDALAISNNVFFARLGEALGFERVRQYVRLFGFGEKAGWNIPGEQLGTFPEAQPRHGGVGRLTSFGEEIAATPLQQAAFVSAIANGGTLYYLQYPRTPEELAQFIPKIKRRLDIQSWIPAVLPGMMAAVERGTARRAYDPQDPIFGKTGTFSQDGVRLGWFTSYNELGSKLAVVVLLRGGRATFGPRAAEVAGRVYKSLNEHNYFANHPELPTGSYIAGDSCCSH
ncbi:MAG: penicillin-binding protein [Acidobacteria bacterium]|nr:penicillin-binding protein [Acidobacteriota bacterium]